MPDQIPCPSFSWPDDFFRRTLSAAAVAMIATDAAGRIVFFNDQAGRLLAADPARQIGRQLRDLVPPERHSLLERLFRRTVDRGLVTRLDVDAPNRQDAPLEPPLAPADQAPPRDLACLMSPIYGPDGAALGVAAWVIDETRRQRLSQADRLAAMATLSAGVAHHFNNILGGVATLVDFALTSGDQAAMKRALQATAEAAARASGITRSLLAFARRDLRRHDLADLSETVMTFAHTVEPDLAKRGIVLRCDLQPAPMLAVEAAQVNRVLGNLLANAEDAMPAGGTVTIAVSGQGGRIALSLADTGCGIAPEHTPRIYEPFFTTKAALAGGPEARIGLGLSVVHSIVAEMGGRIDVESQPGRGTKFTITFPPAQLLA